MFINKNKLFFVIITCILSGLVLVSNSQEVFAYTATLTTGTDIKLNASPSGDGTSIHEESINVVSDCRAGYNLSIATPEGSNLYTNGDGSTTAVFTAVDGTSALNSTNNTNKWGYTLTSNPTSSTVFSPLSSTQSVLKTASQTANPNANINDTFSINYGVKVDNTIVPGSYKMANSGSIVYYLTMAEACNVVDIAYDGNNADEGTMGAVGTGVIHTGVKDGDTVSLIASNFSRSGYGFAGWSLDPNAGTKLVDNDNTNNPIVYGPQEDVTLPNGFIANDTDNDGIVKLYAVWIESQGNLQGWMGCANLDTTTYDSTTGALDLTKNSITALTDQRDHDTYAVARLADGNCWMIENLRLDNDAAHNSDGLLAQGYGTSATYGHFAGLADPESANFSDSTTANSLYSIDGSNSTINIGMSAYMGYRMPRYNNLNTPNNASNRPQNPTSNSFTNDDTTVGMYSYGNYYTWHAAIADTSYYDSGDHGTTSLCPTGWRLPIGAKSTANMSFGKLSVSLGGPGGGAGATSSSTPTGTEMSKIFRSYPNNFLYSGGFYTSSASGRGDDGGYWSSTTSDYEDSWLLSLYGTYVYPGNVHSYKSGARSIRCLASEPGNYTLTYNANGGSGAPTSPEPVYANGSAVFTISSTTPTRSGYTFVGWIDEKGNETQSGGRYITNNANAILYAIWTNNSCNPTATTIGTGNSITDAVCLQDVTPNMKASLPYADSTTGTYSLIDARDGQSYNIAKLADDNLWMTKNLNYSSTNFNTPHDTDISSSIFRLPESTTTSNTDNTAVSIRTTNNSGNNDNGTYYSWPAAIASTASHSGGNVISSICPKGWDLPIDVQYINLRNKADYRTGNLTTYVPSSFLINGGFTNGAVFYQTSYSHFWTSTAELYSVAYGARVDSTTMDTSYSADTTYGGNRYYRKNVRCIASQGTITINFNGNNNDGGSTASQENVEINSTQLRKNGFTRTNYSFKNWNTAANGSGTTIANSAILSSLNLTPGDTITLYAQWAPQRQIIYNDNCGYNNVGCDTNEDTTGNSNWVSAGGTLTLGSDSYFSTRPGYMITSWNTTRDGSGTSYNTSSNYTVPSNLSEPDQVTLYAQWSPALTINFNSNGGTGTMTAQLIPENTSKALKNNRFTAPSGNYFIGWMTEESRANNEVIYANGATYTAPTTVTPGDSITLYAKWGPRYTIIYNGNNATGGSMVSGGTELKHTNINEGNNVNLYAPNYWKTNYGFVGWSPSPTATVGGTDPIYGPNETISAPAYDKYGQEINGTKTVTLYAIWLEADSNKTMQTFTTSDCQNLSQTTFNSTTGKITTPAGSIIALKDQRDNNIYAVARLADGNCWMTENLRLEAANTVGNNQYDSSVTNESLSQGYGGVFTGLDSTENANFTNTTTATPNNLYNSINITGSSTGYRFPRYNNNNTKTSLTASYSGTGSSTYYSWYSYGNYYSWAAAMANTTYYDSATGTSGSESADTSICPTNWTLPTSGTTTEDFGTLSRSYDGSGENQSSSVISNRFRTFPNNFLYSGRFNGSSANYRGSSGNYWSRSASSNNYSYNLALNSTNLYPSSYYSDYRSYGFSVRCLVDNTYTIKYDGNNATGGSMISDGTELKHGGLVGGETIDLYPSNYYKDGYGFAGWSTDPNAWAHFTDNDSTNDPVIYGPIETIIAPAHPGNRIMTLYAVWVPAEEDGNDNPVYLQDFDATSCSNLTSTTFDSDTGAITVNKNSVIALTDQRDGNVYTVARLADGNCWMIENLRLEAENTVGNNQYDTSVTNESLSQGYGGVFTGLDSSENANFTDSTTATPNNLYNSTNITGSSTGYRFPRYNNNNTKTSLTASYSGTGSSTYYSWYSYGNYYSWAAAMANTTYYDSATGTSGSESADTSICPTNWTLPTSGTTTEDFGTLSTSYGGTGATQSGTSESGDIMSNRFRTFPNNFLYSGDFYDSSANYRGTSGYYWSRSAYGYYSYNLGLDSTLLYPSLYNNKYLGFSVRCLVGS